MNQKDGFPQHPFLKIFLERLLLQTIHSRTKLAFNEPIPLNFQKKCRIAKKIRFFTRHLWETGVENEPWQMRIRFFESNRNKKPSRNKKGLSDLCFSLLSKHMLFFSLQACPTKIFTKLVLSLKNPPEQKVKIQ
jgi:hypothetical protein